MVIPLAQKFKDLVARRSKAFFLPMLESAHQSSNFTNSVVLQSRTLTETGRPRGFGALWGHGNSRESLNGFNSVPARPHSSFAAVHLFLSTRMQLPARRNSVLSGIARILSARCQGPLALQVRSMADAKLVKYYKKPATRRQIMKAKKWERQRSRLRKEVAIKSVWKTPEYVSLVQSFILEKGWGAGTIESLEPLAVALNTRRVALILKKVKNPVVALRFFWWSGLQEGCKPTLNLFCDMIKTVVSHGMYQDMWRLLETKQPEAEKLTKLVFPAIMKSYGAWEGGEKEALRTYERLKDLGYYPDVVAYNCLLQILVNATDHFNAYKVFQDMLKEGRVPDRTTYNTIMQGLLQQGNLNGVLNVFEKMEESGCEPNLASYNYQISAYIRLDKFEEASRVLDEMRQRNILPDVSNCAALINHYTQRSNLDGAYQLFEEMKRKGLVRLNTSLYCTIIRSLCQASRVDDASSLLEEMVALGLDRQLHKHQLSNLIDSFSNAGARQAAVELLSLMNREKSSSGLSVVIPGKAHMDAALS